MNRIFGNEFADIDLDASFIFDKESFVKPKYNTIRNFLNLASGGLLLNFDQSNLIPQNGGWYRLPIALQENQGINWLRIDKGGVTYFPPIQYDSGFLINFEDNITQTIKVKIS